MRAAPSFPARPVARALALGFLALLGACGGPPGAGPDDAGGPIGGDVDAAMQQGSDAAPPPSCEARTYFEQSAWPEVFSACVGCHVPQGLSGGTRFVLRPPANPDALAQNFTVVATAARTLTQSGNSLLVQKPTGALPHGGGVVIPPGSAKEMILKQMVQTLLDPKAIAACGGETRSPVDGLELTGPRATLRKAAIELAGRLPTEAEYVAAEAGDPNTLSGLDPVLTKMMGEEAFLERVKEMWNDLLLTDSNRVENGTHLVVNAVSKRLRAATYCDGLTWQNLDERTKTAQSTVCIQASELLGREPVEIIAHVVRGDRPFSEILTAQYRLFNVYTATLFGLDLTPFAGHMTDPKYIVETRFPAMHGPNGLPEEYAGVVSTTSWMTRYYSTSSNRNRGRAYQYAKMFLDHDIFQSGSRIDLSQIDLTKSPWRYDPQCTGCHASIDPVAGAFQHWTDCYDNHAVEYFATRYCGRPGSWWPEDDMFAPGTGPGDGNRISAQQLPTALAVLAAATVKDPSFARAVAAHTFTTLTGHERLGPPTDPGAPDYAALDAAYELQAKTIDSLAAAFVAGNFDYKKLVVAVVKTPAFRAANADKAGRAELIALGGGSLLTPEVLHRKIASVLDGSWSTKGGASDPAPTLRDPPHWLLSLQRFRVFAGGIDSIDVPRRNRGFGSLPSAVSERMALEMACQYTAYDFALDRADRKLFPLVDKEVVPSGDPNAPDQKAILDNLGYLHERLWGEKAGANDPELLATYQLLSDLRKNGAAAVQAGKEPAALADMCSAKVHYATNAALPQNKQFTADNGYVVRAWQGVIAYMLLDYRFLFNE